MSKRVKKIKLPQPKETKEERIRREVNEKDQYEYRNRNYDYMTGRYPPKISDDE
jgi:hypothetical protein